ncbi:MAG: hypothetical protein UT34_C0002G0313 [candidate division WS6 bacterium GW2011_GWF2_39_15]|uniref:Uncharacterized protein n=1 Tax=candidate division WS6 bacterium GW2011_GWF2_39_15 TaxID=1619100 RepID=A0A0G0MZ12_9BACT|nr:MAG: hypothetical protein UT34_C0002G0313 [candidate division WS6 bacterium GW2011_GWF2_39_15]
MKPLELKASEFGLNGSRKKVWDLFSGREHLVQNIDRQVSLGSNGQPKLVVSITGKGDVEIFADKKGRVLAIVRINHKEDGFEELGRYAEIPDGFHPTGLYGLLLTDDIVEPVLLAASDRDPSYRNCKICKIKSVAYEGDQIDEIQKLVSSDLAFQVGVAFAQLK